MDVVIPVAAGVAGFVLAALVLRRHRSMHFRVSLDLDDHRGHEPPRE